MNPLQTLLSELDREFAGDPKGLRVAHKLEAYAREHHDWRDYALFDESSYARNLVRASELYELIFVRPALSLGRSLWKRGDEGTIDRCGPHGAAYAVGLGNRVTARLQSGYLYSYALVMLLGLIGAASWAIWWAR